MNTPRPYKKRVRDSEEELTSTGESEPERKVSRKKPVDLLDIVEQMEVELLKYAGMPTQPTALIVLEALKVCACKVEDENFCSILLQ